MTSPLVRTAPALLLAAALLTGCGGGGDQARVPSRSDRESRAATSGASPTDSSTAGPTGDSAGSTTELEVPRSATGRCMMPDATTLRTADVAVDAEVTSVDGNRVVLEPRRFYTGPRTDEVVVTTPPKALSRVLRSIEFREGRRYLVAGSDGRVMICGFSAPWTVAHANLYTQAFER